MGGLGEVGKEGQSSVHTPKHLLASPHLGGLNQTWQLFNFPKAKSNLQPSVSPSLTHCYTGTPQTSPTLGRRLAPSHMLLPLHFDTQTEARTKKGNRGKEKITKPIFKWVWSTNDTVQLWMNVLTKYRSSKLSSNQSTEKYELNNDHGHTCMCMGGGMYVCTVHSYSI